MAANERVRDEATMIEAATRRRNLLDAFIQEFSPSQARMQLDRQIGVPVRRRKFSTAARRRMSAGMRKYWAKRHAAKAKTA